MEPLSPLHGSACNTVYGLQPSELRQVAGAAYACSDIYHVFSDRAEFCYAALPPDAEVH